MIRNAKKSEIAQEKRYVLISDRSSEPPVNLMRAYAGLCVRVVRVVCVYVCGLCACCACCVCVCMYEGVCYGSERYLRLRRNLRQRVGDERLAPHRQHQIRHGPLSPHHGRDDGALHLLFHAHLGVELSKGC